MPVTPTYDLIASNVLTSSASSVTFSSIPATYRDLILVVNIPAGSNVGLRVRFNGDTGGNYNVVFMSADGDTPASGTLSSQTNIVLNQNSSANATAGSLVITQINDYSATDKHKTVLARSGNPAYSGVTATAARWANTAAINEITAVLATYPSGTSFYLYGIVS